MSPSSNTLTIDTTSDRDDIDRAIAKAQGSTHWLDVKFTGPEGGITSKSHPARHLRLAAASFRGESIAPYRFANPALNVDYAVDFGGVLNAEWVATPRRELRAVG